MHLSIAVSFFDFLQLLHKIFSIFFKTFSQKEEKELKLIKLFSCLFGHFTENKFLLKFASIILARLEQIGHLI